MTMRKRACSGTKFPKNVKDTPSLCISFAAVIMGAWKNTRNTLKALPDNHNSVYWYADFTELCAQRSRQLKVSREHERAHISSLKLL